MNINNKIINILNSSFEDKSSKLDEISDLIEFNSLNIAESSINNLLNTLISAAIKCSDFSIQESMLNLSTIILTFSGTNSKLDLDILNNNIDTLNGSCLEHALFILGFSNNSNYIDTLKRYTFNKNREIKTTASEALSELISRNSTITKEDK